MANGRAAAYGAAAFVVAHWIIRWQWSVLGGAHVQEPSWFLNAPLGVMVVVFAENVAGTIAALEAGPRARWTRAAWVTAGGIVAMLAAMPFVVAGTIAPLAAFVGALVIGAGAYSGGFFASLFGSHD